MPVFARGSHGVTAKSELRDFAFFDFDDVHRRHALSAFLALRPFLVEGDVAVDALNLDLPERLLDRRRFRLTGRLDRRDDGHDAVVAAEALGQPADVVLARVPLA